MTTPDTSKAMTAERLAEIRELAQQSRTWPGLREVLADSLAHIDAQAIEVGSLFNLKTAAEARAERLAEALRYMMQVREIKCEHKHPPPDDCCAKCNADAVLATLSPKAGTE